MLTFDDRYKWLWKSGRERPSLSGWSNDLHTYDSTKDDQIRHSNSTRDDMFLLSNIRPMKGHTIIVRIFLFGGVGWYDKVQPIFDHRPSLQTLWRSIWGRWGRGAFLWSTLYAHTAWSRRMLLLTRDLFVYSYNYNITYTLTTSLTCMSKTIYFWYLGFSGLFCWQENFADSQRREFPVSLKASWGRNHYFSLSSRTRSGKTRKLQQGVRLLIWDSHFDSRCIFHILNDSALSVLFF